MPSPSNKRDAYAKRNSTGIDAPLEVDSDSDFAPGPYVPEPTKPKRLTKKRGLAKSKRSALSDDSEDFLPVKKVSSHRAKNKRSRPIPIATNGTNLLQELFAKVDLALPSSSEEEVGTENEEDEDEEEEAEDLSDEWDASQAPSLLPPVMQARLPPKQAALAPPADDGGSETEPESDPLPPPKRKASPVPDNPSPVKRQKTTFVEDDSVTESDPEWEEQCRGVILSAKHIAPTNSSDGSATEPESDYSDRELVSRPRPKPNFPLGAGQTAADQLTLDAAQGFHVPGAINTYLRPYQREGVEFFWRQYKDGHGGLLGDDMGLGKTIQVISFLSAIMKKSGISADHHRRKRYVSKLQDGEDWKSGRKLPPANVKWATCLIIAPSTVCHNWEREFQTWAYFEVGMHTGPSEERKHVLKDFKMGRLDVVITSFDLARRDIELLDDQAWSCIIIDEVHRVKNESSSTTKAFHQFTCMRRFGLTGTAIQNSYKELWTILNWTNPGKVGSSKEWNKYVTKPLALGQSASASEEERAMAQIVALTLRDKLLPVLFLRRTKDIIKDQLPKKVDNVVFCPLTPAQIGAYKRILEMDGVQNLINRDKPCPCKSGKSRKNCCHPFVPGDLFKFMNILIKLSNHLALIMPGPKDTPEQLERNREIARVVWPSQSQSLSYGLAMLRPEFCGKWKTLETLLREWRKDPTNKVLIFTKSVKLLDMLDFHLKNKNHGFLKLDGSTKQVERMPMIDRFHSDPDIFIFLISTLAGGTGLNLTGANKVVIFDPNWNPAHDLQAMDRAFRIGQTRDVSVFRLLGAGSVEELIYARQIYKQQQMAIGYEASVQTRYFKGVQGDASKPGELFGLGNIFSLHEDKLATKTAIERANVAELDWALANLGRGGSSRKKRLANSANSAVLEAEKHIGGEDSELRGLASLLFDDAPPPKTGAEQDDMQKILGEIGVKYSHVNDQILAPSRIEEEHTKQLVQKARQKRLGKAGRKGTTKNKEGGISSGSGPAVGSAQWPPIRKHHNKEESVEERISARYDALVARGDFEVPSHAVDLAQQMRTWTHLQRETFFRELDDYRDQHMAK